MAAPTTENDIFVKPSFRQRYWRNLQFVMQVLLIFTCVICVAAAVTWVVWEIVEYTIALLGDWSWALLVVLAVLWLPIVLMGTDEAQKIVGKDERTS